MITDLIVDLVLCTTFVQGAEQILYWKPDVGYIAIFVSVNIWNEAAGTEK